MLWAPCEARFMDDRRITEIPRSFRLGIDNDLMVLEFHEQSPKASRSESFIRFVKKTSFHTGEYLQGAFASLESIREYY